MDAVSRLIGTQLGVQINQGHPGSGRDRLDLRIDARERLARLRGERKAIIETRPTGAIVAAINNARRSEQPALREALAMAKRRDALDAELAFFEQRLGSIPRVTSADASASVLSEISGATVSVGMLRKFRLAALLGLPLTGGLVLSIAFVLVPTRRSREGMAS